MADKTKIEWTDASWTPIRARNRETGKVGWFCTHFSPGCAGCYSESMNRRLGTGVDFKPGLESRVEMFLDEKMLTQPLRWKRPRMIFVCSMTDLFGEFVPDEWIDRVFAVMAIAHLHTHQVLTKRTARMKAYMDAPDRRDRVIKAMREFGVHFAAIPWPLANVWMGTSVEDQRRADERIPVLLDTPAALRWISAEPLLGNIDLTWIAQPDDKRDGVIDSLAGLDWIEGQGLGSLQRIWRYPANAPGIADGHVWKRFVGPQRARLDWVVAGGESGPGARPMHPDWARSLRDQCAAAGVPFLFKQWGAWAHSEQTPAPVPGPSFFDSEGSPSGDGWRFWTDGDRGADASIRIGKKAAGRLLDGVTHDGYPSAPT